MKIKKLNEGTWALDKSKHRRAEEGKKYITKIEKLKKEIYSTFGDDSLFDEFDGAIRRIEELMEIPESEIKESKIEVLDDEEFYLFNLKMKDIRKIIVLIYGGLGINMDDKNFLKSINIRGMKQPSSHKEKGGEYIFVNSTQTPFEIKIWEDGFVALENGMDVKLKYENALKIYDVLLKRMK